VIVVRSRLRSTITIAGGEVERRVWTSHDLADATKNPLQEGFMCLNGREVGGSQDDAVQVLSARRAEEEVVRQCW
jgi:hypothetical protein